MAVIVATNVVIMHGIKIEVGSEAFNDALIAIMLTGIKVSPAACKHKNIICELEAVCFFRIQFLQAFHGFQAKRSGRIIEA